MQKYKLLNEKSPVTNTELNYLDGVTSPIQTQIGSKQNNINNLTTLTCNKLISETSAGTYGLEVICSRPIHIGKSLNLKRSG